MEQMGLMVEASAGAFEAWLHEHVHIASAKRFPVYRGVARYGPAEKLPLSPDLPLRWKIAGVDLDEQGYIYPLVPPIHVEVTPVGRGDRVAVIVHCRHPEAQAYMVDLVAAMTERWPRSASSVWINQPPAPGRCLGQLRLKASLADLGLGLQDFTDAYRAEGITHATVIENAHPAPRPESSTGRHQARRRRAWEIRLHLPGSTLPCLHIRELPLTLEAIRMPGQYPLSFTLTSPWHACSEVRAFAESFMVWCRETFRTAPVIAPPVTARPTTDPSVTGRAGAEAATPTNKPWEQIPDHLWDRRALRLWWEGLTCPEIGRRLSQAPKTVRNRLTLLRKEYGTDVVPTNRRRRAPTSQVGTPG